MENIAIKILREEEKKYEEILNNLRYSIKVLVSANGSVAANRHLDNGKTNEDTQAKVYEHGRETGSIKRIAATLKEKGRFLHKRQLEELTGIVNASPFLSHAKKNGKESIISYQPGVSRNQTVWGLTEWLGENGKPKPEFMFDEEFVLSIK